MHRKAIAVDIGGTGIQIAYVDENDGILKQVKIPTDADKGGKDILKRIGDEIETMVDNDIVGIGVGTAGQIDNEGTIRSTANIKNWTGLNIKGILEERFNLPVQVVNDVQAMALGEMTYGYSFPNMISLAIGTGVGGAIITDGKLYRGSNGSAGELGHTILVPFGSPCGCGSMGCVERYISGPAIERIYFEKTGIHKDGIDIFKEEEDASKEVIQEFLGYLNITLANIANTFAPEAIVLSGGVAQSLDRYMDEIERSAQKSSLSANQKVKILQSKLSHDAMVLGAASTIFTSIN